MHRDAQRRRSVLRKLTFCSPHMYIHPQVQDVKAAIEQENAEFSAARLALTCSGQVLNGRSTLAECGVKEEDVLVCTEAKV